MSTIALDYTGQTGDLDTSGHRLKLAFGEEAIEQNLRIRLRFWLGEFFLDRRQGIPYFRDILIKNPLRALIAHIFRQAILGAAGVERVDSLEANINAQQRTLSLAFSAVMDTGDMITFGEYSPFIIEI